MSHRRFLGIDAGSISVGAALLDENRKIVKSAYRFHNGRIHESLAEIIREMAADGVDGISVTSSTPRAVHETGRYDSRICYITAAAHFHKKAGSILIIGGEKFGLVRFDEYGEYLNYRSNTSCAAGTGSFLDQQAKRLNLKGIEEFSEISFRNTGEIPKIASRCSVFAKTDLIHAQQEGFSIEEICDGLSYGLARNVADTLFSNANFNPPLIFAGGVSKNKAVVKHIENMAGMKVVTDDFSHLYGAIGAVICLMNENMVDRSLKTKKSDDLILPEKKEKKYHYPVLKLELSDYPVFESRERYDYASSLYPRTTAVETDIYEIITGHIGVYLGIDIGSTSTKAVLLDNERRVLAGFYTRTSGRPIEAVQAIFEGIDDLARKKNITFTVLGAGTTGSGRKFIGEIIGADVALDEITAHARAACELDPAVDTIIEIGGQDAKFTTMKNGMVTFSIMNNVCAAGTGSFIEEQAKKLGCPLDEYSQRAERAPAPLSSDRCTVFMERDLNYYVSQGYSVDEMLASVLHSVRENYLSKVAIEKSIGERIFFQGATAKNRALVAAFEQRLGKRIAVSKYCHLTGALGVALYLLEENASRTRFKGVDIYRNSIPVKSEVCELCTNHCKIRVAEVNGETVAFGFLCGRDYDTEKFVASDKGFDLLALRKRIFSFDRQRTDDGAPVIGIPAALHLFDEMPLWQKFFDLLNIKTVTSETYKNAVKDGKGMAGAEFCAPMSGLHGHVRHLLGRADYVFLPDYMEITQNDRNIKRNYCYYTQYAPQVVAAVSDAADRERIINPLVRSIDNVFNMKVNLYRALASTGKIKATFFQVSNAYDGALEFYESRSAFLKKMFIDETSGLDDIAVVFLGRPYTIMSKTMNNGIPDIFSRNGIKTFFQDMVPETDTKSIQELLDTIHWKYGSKILEAAESVGRMKGIYPVFVTSFKCTPDSYVIDLLKGIMERHDKPYLILQLDEHDSSVGYETRIEAGIRAFRNHRFSAAENGSSRKIPERTMWYRGKKSLQGKTLLFPNWDKVACLLVEAMLRKEGIDARLVKETPDSIKRSMSMNSGQCIPLSVMVQNFIDYIEENGLDPESTVIWNPKSKLACNIGMFPFFTKQLFEAHGRGMGKVGVYTGEMTFTDFPIRVVVKSYFAHMFAGYLNRIACSIRPYENEKGATDRTIDEAVSILYDTFLNDGSKEKALDHIIGRFERIAVTRTKRPKVAIFGDLYVRDNEVMNQELIRTIEKNGGEVVTTPYSEFMQIVSAPYLKKWLRQGQIGEVALLTVLQKIARMIEKKYYRYFSRILKDNDDYRKYCADPDDIFPLFGLKTVHTGESMENILKIFYLVKKYPDLSLFVQTNPSYCCPSLVTEAMADRIEELTGVPIVTIEYDGTGGSKNDDVVPYLRFPRKRDGAVKKCMTG
ncbi:MAG TPA: acyl-CoA dehydratase activase [Spirochaetota bacterium]|nr:acyl-CoA dehydratase activase [Spirochaetota bacterium]